MLVEGISWCGRSILLIGRKKDSKDVWLFRSQSEILKKRNAVARQVFGARSLRDARIIIERIKTWEQEILVLIWVPLKLFLFLNTSYLFPASARAILGKVSTRSRGLSNIYCCASVCLGLESDVADQSYRSAVWENFMDTVVPLANSDERVTRLPGNKVWQRASRSRTNFWTELCDGFERDISVITCDINVPFLPNSFCLFSWVRALFTYGDSDERNNIIDNIDWPHQLTPIPSVQRRNNIYIVMSLWPSVREVSGPDSGEMVHIPLFLALIILRIRVDIQRLAD